MFYKSLIIFQKVYSNPWGKYLLLQQSLLSRGRSLISSLASLAFRQSIPALVNGSSSWAAYFDLVGLQHRQLGMCVCLSVRHRACGVLLTDGQTRRQWWIWYYGVVVLIQIHGRGMLVRRASVAWLIIAHCIFGISLFALWLHARYGTEL